MAWVLKDGQANTWQMNYGIEGVYETKMDAINDYWNQQWTSTEMSERETNEYIRFRDEMLEHEFDYVRDVHLINIYSIGRNIELEFTLYEESEYDDHTISMSDSL